ncbi:MAG: hypothetical protein ACJAVR_002546 [Paracoccaceae bacterium]|jgi:hypothetical protein
MGRKSKKPSANAALEDIAAGQVVEKCPLKRKGALRFVVTLDDGADTALTGAVVTITGPAGEANTNQSCGAGGNARADFQNQTQGGYIFEADFAASGLAMLEHVSQIGNTSVIGGKRRIIPLQARQLGELIVEVRKDDNGAEGELLVDVNVVEISAAGHRSEGSAKTDAKRGPDGQLDVQVRVAEPTWIVPPQNMRATIIAGQTETFVVRAIERTWLRPQVWDMEGGAQKTGAWLNNAAVDITAHGATVTITTHGAGDVRTYVKKPLDTYPIDAARTPDIDDGDDIYLFEEFA